MEAFYRCQRGHEEVFSSGMELNGKGEMDLGIAYDDFLSPVIFAFCAECGIITRWEMDVDKSANEFWD